MKVIETPVYLPINTHLSELRKRLIFSLLIFLATTSFCYFEADKIYNFLALPLAELYKDDNMHRLIYTGLTEAFFVYLKLALFCGFFLAFPFIAIQIYFFIAPGLYKHERKILLPYLFFSPLLFIIGGLIAYYYVIPLAWKFFASFEYNNSSLPIILEARVSEYLSLVLSLILGFGIAFQMPLILILLTQFGVLKPKWLTKYRRHAIVGIFIIAAILTPPDVISQVALAIPLMLLYELSVLICIRITKKKNDNA
jgi:sec-independent protein translocase protein TatC